MTRKKYKEQSHYTFMWVVVMFDLPVTTKIEMRKATKFRQSLLELGFIRKQFSVYIKHTESLESAKKLSKLVGSCVVDNGEVSVMFITDRQYGMTQNYYGKAVRRNEEECRLEQASLLIF